MSAAPLNAKELRRVRAFRRGARQVFDAYLPVSTQKMVYVPGTDEADLFSPAEFVQLLAAIRLVFMSQEDGYYFHTNNIIAKHGGEVFRGRAARLRERWRAVLDGDFALTVIEGGGTPGAQSHRYDAKAVLDVWFNAKVFHQDADKLPDLERLEAMGNLPPLVLHLTVWQLARAIIGQDIVLAEFLGEERLPVEKLADGPEG
jgi:hypothetical protein